MTPAASESTEGRRLEYGSHGFTMVLTFAPDGSSCFATYQPSGGPPLSQSQLHELLSEAGVNTGLQEDAIGLLMQRAQEGVPVSGLLLAQGVPMIAGEDGRITLNRQGLEPGPSSEESTRSVDFRQVQEFLNVQEGEVVATIVAPGDGTPGVTVFGAEIPAVPGKPVVVRLGKGVSLAEGGTEIIATGGGRVFCRDGEVSVEDVYLVSGDVDFKVGNIEFNGFLEVTGDILDGFKVTASKGVKVHGNVGACAISSAGDITFCGMNGQGSGTVLCGGTLRANFIYDARIEVAQDVIVESEIRLCGIKCLGAIRVKRGGIVGGECVALAGVDVGTLGSVTNLHTRVVVGVSYRDLEEITRCFDELKVLTDRQKLAEGTKAERDLTLRERARITGLIREIRARQYEGANAKVNIRKILYGGVTVSLDMLAEEFREERPGPFSMIENKLEGGLRFLGMTELSLKASWIEGEFQRQAQIARMR